MMYGYRHIDDCNTARSAFDAAWLVLMALVAALLLAGAPDCASADDGADSVPLLMIVVEFDDAGGDSQTPYEDVYDWHETVFGQKDSLASYYRDMSNGRFTFSPAPETSAAGMDGNHNAADAANDGIVHITLDQPHGAWGLVNEDRDIAREFGLVVLRAFRTASPYVDYAQFDRNGDALLTPDELAVCICVAGYDASALEDPGRSDIPVMWPHAGTLRNSGSAGEQADGMQITSYIAIAENLWTEGEPLENSEQEPLGILYHELGHYLGLPDLYALNDDPASGPWGAYEVGMLSLMDKGGWAEAAEGDNSYRYRPMGFDAWSRYVLGWETPRIVTESGDYEVRSQSSANGYSSLLVPTSDPDEFFVIENRQPEGHDEAIPTMFANGNVAGGIVIWHIDKSVYRDNSLQNTANDTTHRPAVMEEYLEANADGSEFTNDWADGQPLLDEPFHDKAASEYAFGDEMAEIELPLYGNGSSPSERVGSGIALRFPSQSAREMTVHIELASQRATTNQRAYPLDAESKSQMLAGSSAIGDVACAALMLETEADAAFVDVDSIRSGLPAGEATWSEAYSVLPDNSTIETYYVTGEQLLNLAEQALDANLTHRTLATQGQSTAQADKPALAIGGISFEADWGAPSGSRISAAQIGGKPLDPASEYRIAVTQGTAEGYPLFEALNRDITTLWGSPADALRSLVVQPDWETKAANAAGERTYIEAPAPAALFSQQTDAPSLLAPIAIATIALIAIGGIAIAIRRRGNR